MKIIACLICVFLLAACAAGKNPNLNAPDPRSGEKKETASFFQGLWHGVILPVTFVISLFSPDTGVYETYNNGGWYNFGFFLGLSIIFGGGGGSAGVWRRRKQ